jgi:hypothetical protein
MIMTFIKILLSPLYLLPAAVGLLFFILTRDKLIIDRRQYNAYRRPDGSIRFPLEMRPFWEGIDYKPYYLFLMPGVNVIILIVTIIAYYLSRKATQSYLENNDSISKRKRGDKG